jgi:hypothetical protein
VQLDKKIQLTGSGTDAKVEGIQSVTNPQDAASKQYVDDAVNAVDGSETIINAGTNISVTGSGTSGDPYVIGVSGGGGCPTLAIGDAYGGGIVIDTYYPASPCRYLIAPTSDQSNAATWGCSGTFYGSTLTAVGYGQMNSNRVLAECPTAGIAVRICDQSTHGGFSDWFLASVYELQYVYDQRKLLNLMSGGYYWSSSEHNAVSAWMYEMGGGGPVNQFDGVYKYDASYEVRCVRAF